MLLNNFYLSNILKKDYINQIYLNFRKYRYLVTILGFPINLKLLNLDFIGFDSHQPLAILCYLIYGLNISRCLLEIFVEFFLIKKKKILSLAKFDINFQDPNFFCLSPSTSFNSNQDYFFREIYLLNKIFALQSF